MGAVAVFSLSGGRSAVAFAGPADVNDMSVVRMDHDLVGVQRIDGVIQVKLPVGALEIVALRAVAVGDPEAQELPSVWPYLPITASSASRRASAAAMSPAPAPVKLDCPALAVSDAAKLRLRPPISRLGTGRTVPYSPLSSGCMSRGCAFASTVIQPVFSPSSDW